MNNWAIAGEEFVPASTCSFITPLVGLLGDIGLTGTMATVGAGVLQGAGVGAGLGALTGGGALKGAAIGGIGGGVLAGIGGVGGYGAGTGGEAAPTLGTLSDGTVLGAAASNGGNMLLDGEGAPLTDASGNILYASQTGNATTASDGSTINPVSQAAAATAGGGGKGALGGGGGISNTALGLGALAMLGSSLSKPQVGTWATPGPSSVTQGATYNTAYTPSGTGRITQNPFQSGTGPQANGAPGTPANYWNYSQPQSYFGNNSLGAYGFAGGGPLSLAAGGGKEFSTRHGEHYVQGDGDGQQDRVPAALSDGEFVFDAGTVSRLGNGSNRVGAQRLEQARRAIAHDAGSDRVVQKKIRKSPLEYVAQAAGGRR